MATTIDLDGGALVVRPAPADKARIAGLPAANFRPLEGAYALPATIAAAANVAAVLPDEPPPRWSPDALDLLERAIDAVEARALRDAEDLPDLPDPTGQAPPAYLHQRQAFHFALRQEAAALWVGMGGGKTRVAYLLAHAWECRRVLVVCPRSVLDDDDVWKREERRWLGRHFEVGGRVYRRDGKPKARPSVPDRVRQLEKDEARADARGRPFVAVAPVDSFWRGDLADWILAREWDLVVFDEIHRLKAPGGKAAKFAARVRARARRRLGLSGTLLAHSRLDGYSVLRCLDPAIFGTNYSRFKARYAVTVPLPNAPRAEKVVGWQNEDEFDRKLHSVTYVWEKDREALGLAEPVFLERRVRLGPETRRVYDELDLELIADVGSGVVTAANAMVRLLRLQQVCSGVVTLADGAKHRLGGEKAGLLAEVLEDLPQAEPVVVFCRFHGDLDSVLEVAERQGRRPAELSGRTHGGLDLWKAGAADVLAVQIQAGGTGIDLSRAAYGIYFSVGFSLVDYDQSMSRIDRPPAEDAPARSSAPTFVRLVAADTVDEEVYAALDSRRDAIEAVVRARQRVRV